MLYEHLKAQNYAGKKYLRPSAVLPTVFHFMAPSACRLVLDASVISASDTKGDF